MVYIQTASFTASRLPNESKAVVYPACKFLQTGMLQFKIVYFDCEGGEFSSAEVPSGVGSSHEMNANTRLNAFADTETRSFLF